MNPILIKPMIILTRPQMGENIGGAARAAMNFGIESLKLVAPRDGWPNEKALASSAHAKSVIESATIHSRLEGALAESAFAFAITARPRDIDLPVYNAEQAMTMLQSNQMASFVFGPENNGLTTQEVAMCNAVIQIPTSPRNPSLNLAQAVGIVSYEWSKLVAHTQWQAASECENAEEGATDKVLHGDTQALYAHFIRLMDEKNFYNTQAMKPVLQRNLRAMLSRSHMNAQDIQTMHGILKAISR